MTSRSFCFTLNNYSSEQVLQIKGNVGTIAKYAVFGKEVGANGTPHLQGYIQLIKNTRFNTHKKWWTDVIQAQPHIEAAKGSPQQNKEYCTKQGDFWEFGECPQQGKRNDLTQFLEDAKVMDKSELQDTHPSNYIRYHKAAADVKKTYDEEKALQDLKDEYKDAALRQWQTDVLHDLLHQDDREIIWLVDEEGGKGKTWFSKYLIANHHAFYVRGGKHADIAYAYKKEPIIIFDFPRTMEEHTPYDLVEKFKDGLVFSSKYESTLKVFKNPKVLVCSNFRPIESKLSADRWNIITLN